MTKSNFDTLNLETSRTLMLGSAVQPATHHQGIWFLVEITSADQSHKLASPAGSVCPIVAVPLHNVTIQRAGNSVEKISCDRVAKTTKSSPVLILKPPDAFRDHSRILDLLICRHSRTLDSPGSTFKREGRGCIGGKSANFDDSFTPLHNVKHYCALDHANFS